MTKQQQYIIGGVVLFFIGMFFLRFELPVISVAAEPLSNWSLFGLVTITNSLLTSVIAVILIIVVTLIGTRNMQLVPSGLQNILEFIVEGLYNLTESICGPEWVKKFYLIPITIFFYVLVSNLLGLLPFVPAIGLCEAVHHGTTMPRILMPPMPKTTLRTAVASSVFVLARPAGIMSISYR